MQLFVYLFPLFVMRHGRLSGIGTVLKLGFVVAAFGPHSADLPYREIWQVHLQTLGERLQRTRGPEHVHHLAKCTTVARRLIV